jgi:5-methyltetrahydrofolate--homocysteine methyltransferase
MRQEEIYQNVIDGKTAAVEAGVNAALAAGVDADIILNQSLIAAMEEVGRRFEAGDYYVPEMLIAAHAMQTGLGLLKPLLVQMEIKPAGIVAIGTVKGDLHDIGKNLVAMMLEGAGFEVKDLGTDVPPEIFVNAVNEGAQVIGMSALLTTTMGNMFRTIEMLEKTGLRDKVKVIIGGAPVTKEYADKIGADSFAPDAASAPRTILELLA